MITSQHDLVELINETSQRIKHQNRAYYFSDDMVNIEDFHSNLLNIEKNRMNTLIFTISVTSQLRNLVIVNIFIA